MSSEDKTPEETKAAEYKCPYDGLNTIWTGKTVILLSKTFYEMKCINGHETLAESPL